MPPKIVFKAKGKKRMSNALEIRANTYPNPPTFLEAEDGVRYDILRIEKDAFATNVASKEALTKASLNLSGVDPFLEKVGLKILASNGGATKVPTYNIPTFEFVATFDPIRNSDEECVGWSYQLGGKRFNKEKAWLCDLFKFPLRGHIVTKRRQEVREEFWKRISNLDGFACNMIEPNITDPVQRYIHRLVAMSINVRKDGARYVSGMDIDVMVAMEREQPIDWFEVFTDRFTTWNDEKSANKAIGGGLLVSLLCEVEGFDKSTLGTNMLKPLNLKQMVKYQMITKEMDTWLVSHELPKRASQIIARAKTKRRRSDTSSSHLPRGFVEEILEEDDERDEDFEGNEEDGNETEELNEEEVVSLATINSKITRLEERFDHFEQKSDYNMNWMINAFANHFHIPPPPPYGHAPTPLQHSDSYFSPLQHNSPRHEEGGSSHRASPHHSP